LSPRHRLLLEAGKPVRVGSRALDLLIALLERPGELLSKDELISRVWPSTHVTEGNLRFQIAALRRALKDGQEGRRYLESSPGQGYRFVADITVESDAAQPQPSKAPTYQHNLPARLTPLVGRASLVAKLAGQLPAQRLITIVGPGGIGKTSVAIATAEQLIGAYEDGVWIVDLGRSDNPAMVRSSLAAAIGISNPEAPIESLVVALRHARMLLVLDNCSHVIDAVAGFVVTILKAAPGVHILATSREPLRVEGEHIYRLGPLESPPPAERLTSADALRFPAVQLFVDVAAASHDGFELRDEDAPLVGEICRRLDGIPLAIELAAARVDVLGVRGLLARLEDQFEILAIGRRAALPRHRTMRAALDWSYGSLSPPEQIVLSRLGIFVGGFTLAAAAAVAGDPGHSDADIAGLVLELAIKSLVTVEGDDAAMWLRLLDTTRAYALQKLAASERERLARAHAEYYRRLFEEAEAEWETRPAPECLAQYGREIDNLRTALDWAFSPSGDASIGIALAAAAAPLWMHLSLLEECRGRVHQSLGALAAGAPADASREMKLLAALGATLMYTRSATDPKVRPPYGEEQPMRDAAAPRCPMRAVSRATFLALSGAAILGIAACSLSGPAPAEYVLGRMPAATAITLTQTGLPVIELKRVQLPDYLDTTDIMERRGNQLVPSSTGRWGERLSIGMRRALTASLGSRLPGMVVTATPPIERPAIQILVDVAAFEARVDHQVILVARWSIAGGTSRQILITEQASLVEAVTGTGDSAVVAAMSQAVEDLADRLAVRIQSDLPTVDPLLNG
jgi:predicted ATPase/DNA-binding winged helix-turn-helix (wHTH) protein/uncharacterized lipoprotein YmbA